jgi:hypothetical protein
MRRVLKLPVVASAARRGLVGLPVWGLDHGKCPALGVRTLFSKRDGAPSALHGLSDECKALVISTSAVYATAKIDPAVVIDSFDGTMADFKTTCSRVQGNVELEALGARRAVMNVLDTICTAPHLFLDLRLGEVDGIVLQRLGRHLVHVKRAPPQDQSTPGSHRTVSIELSDVSQQTLSILTLLKAKEADYTLAVIHVCISMAGSIVVAALCLR